MELGVAAGATGLLVWRMESETRALTGPQRREPKP